MTFAAGETALPPDIFAGGTAGDLEDGTACFTTDPLAPVVFAAAATVTAVPDAPFTFAAPLATATGFTTWIAGRVVPCIFPLGFRLIFAMPTLAAGLTGAGLADLAACFTTDFEEGLDTAERGAAVARPPERFATALPLGLALFLATDRYAPFSQQATARRV
jgi:hypothetical protein